MVMEYHINQRFDMSHALAKNTVDNGRQWRLFHMDFKDLPDSINVDDLALKIFKIFESLPGGFYFDGRSAMSVFCRMGETIVIDDIIFKIKPMLSGDYVCRMGEQTTVDKGIISLQFVFSPSSAEQQKLSHEFIAQERAKRTRDIIMVVEDDLYSRRIAVGALKGKFKVVEVTDGGRATQEYLSHSPDVVFLDIHLPNKKGPEILQEILEVDPKAYIVMLSADAARDNVVACIKGGAKGFIAKPFKGEKLFDYIRKCPTIRVYC